MWTSGIVLLSEAILALYPILIKKVPTDLNTQLVSRLLTYSVLGFSLASFSDIKQTWGTLKGITRSFSLGALTLFHVLTSYYAFSVLPAGISMSLFYTYPIFNLLGAAFFFGERFGVFELLLVAVAFIGAILLSLSEQENKEKKLNAKGLIAAILAAITESAMYFAVRTAKQPDPFYAVLELYPGGLPILLSFLSIKNISIDLRSSVWLPMILFNALIGFLGYTLRFFAIPRLPTLLFSVLSFIGVIASFVWGYVFVGEIPSYLSMFGGGLIALSAAFVKSEYI